MTTPFNLTELHRNTIFKEGDVFVLFGELFGRGYATGLVDAAKAAGMTVIGVTVGRRDESNTLRRLTNDELIEAERNLGGTIVNVPLMAGFDLDTSELGRTPMDLLKDMSMDNWQSFRLDWRTMESARTASKERFKRAVREAVEKIQQFVPPGRNVLFAHTMAGGIPRSKVFYAIANRVYNGRGVRFVSSQSLLDSDLGKFVLQNFEEVTANSFSFLLSESDVLRRRVEASGGQVYYSAYGYHGTRILISDEYQWQTYTHYTQALAKIRLEEIAVSYRREGVRATVFNCPEIRTNSSDVFAGIELSLLPLLAALRKEGSENCYRHLWEQCNGLLKEGVRIEDVLKLVDEYHINPLMQAQYNFEKWPMPSSAAQVELTVGTSQKIVDLHSDRKEQMTDLLSGHVVDATGKIIFGYVGHSEHPVVWLNHDIVARQLSEAF